MPRLIDIDAVQAALDRRLAHHSQAPVALALSGGGDSMAMLYLALAWAATRGRRLLALTVDHGLHPDSPRWTAFAAKAARAAGADWRGLMWTGEKPSTGLPAAARIARHRLLAQAARDAGASVILFAHTADDIAEGEVMRAASAPTLGYLREWSPSPVWPEGRAVFAFRPLLGIRRETLRAWLRERCADWLEDPANDDLRFARASARAALRSTTVAAAKPRRESGALGDMARLATVGALGQIEIARAALAEVDDETRIRFLSIAVVCAAGRPSPPRGDRLERLRRSLDGGPSFVATLCGARVEADASSVKFMREAGDMARGGLLPLPVLAGQTAVWDGRFEIVADETLTVSPLPGLASRLSKSDRARLVGFAPTLRSTAPVIVKDDAVSLPHPLGDGPASARALCGPRFAAACGLISHEHDISLIGMAQAHRSSYVEALALA